MSRKPKLLPIHIYGDKVLRLKCEEVQVIDENISQFAEDLIATMYQWDGVGLAAPQVGVNKRIIVIDAERKDNPKKQSPLVMINPIIEESSGETETEEGCISIPDIYAKVVRPSNITVSYTDIKNEQHRIKLSGYPAVIVQHECDHLDGILFTDHLSTIARLKIRNKLKELQKNTVDGVNIRCEE
ncbi:MAG: peptide deformylase [Candidatus Cloacimonadaceae bacterium]|jgi:peptide deformylase|nr:peptide deformylase [Candidatus Cloacimonadota bacterium]MCB5258114.1 peptide deformylase [Candidatus Cloacimonadota bacterium]MDD5625202.1 peptide deformylase [Candidatus Cloacimonadota bacterium]MDY0111622.1 peptide deformylase [Candidatus Syntrophosphaera sp.]